MPSDTIPLLHACERLWEALYDRVRVFPKLDKHLFGQRLLDDADACLLAILHALSDIPGRSHHLGNASALFDRCKCKLRIAVQRGLVTERWYASQLDALADIGRMLGAWKRRPPPRS